MDFLSKDSKYLIAKDNRSGIWTPFYKASDSFYAFGKSYKTFKGALKVINKFAKGAYSESDFKTADIDCRMFEIA